MEKENGGLLLSRRSLIAGAAVGVLAHATGRSLLAEQENSSALVIREKEPQNLESNFAALDSPLTSNDRFYIRSHFAVPALAASSWSLSVEGAVSEPLKFSYDQVLALPAESKVVTLECAGNGRVYLTPKTDGVQWQLGAVGTAEWTGVRLNSLLERAGVDPMAVDVVLEGADSGEPSKPSRPGKPIAFARSVPLEHARKGDILLAYKMNGQRLPESHGFPLRAIVPGWYGMASVKWLTRIVVLKQAYQGYFQTIDYAHWQNRDGFPNRVPITEIQVKSQIARPTISESVARGSKYRVFGAAWSGVAPIAKVEVSTDGGKSYQDAKLLGKPIEHAWRLWEYAWNVPQQAGKVTLMAKATDAKGNTQPLVRDKNRENYMINQVLPVEVRIQ